MINLGFFLRFFVNWAPGGQWVDAQFAHVAAASGQRWPRWRANYIAHSLSL